jgi:hypothetical protein
MNKNKRNVIAAGIVIAVIALGLIIISPQMVLVDHVRPQTRDDRPTYARPIFAEEKRTDLSGVAKFFGVTLLITGGIIFAVGFSKKDVGSSEL